MHVKKKQAHIHNKTFGILCHGDHTYYFVYLPQGFLDGSSSLYAFPLISSGNRIIGNNLVMIGDNKR